MGDYARAAGGEIAIGSAPARETAEELDLRGEVCPYTFLKARLALEGLRAGVLLRVPRSLAGAGHTVIECAPVGDGAWAILTRRGPD